MVQYSKAAARNYSVNKTLLKNHKIHGKAPLLEYLFNKIAGPEACNFIKKGLQYSFFSCEFCNIFKDRLFYKTAATNCSGLYIILYQALTAQLCEEEFPRLYTNLANLYFPMTLINSVTKSTAE